MTRTLASPDSVASTPFIPRKRRRTKEEVAAAAKEVADILANAPNEPEGIDIVPESIALRIPDGTPSPEVNGEFQAQVIELGLPSELMGNKKTLSSSHATMTRINDGTGDWLIVAKKTKHRYILGAANFKTAKLK